MRYLAYINQLSKKWSHKWPISQKLSAIDAQNLRLSRKISDSTRFSAPNCPKWSPKSRLSRKIIHQPKVYTLVYVLFEFEGLCVVHTMCPTFVWCFMCVPHNGTHHVLLSHNVAHYGIHICTAVLSCVIRCNTTLRVIINYHHIKYCIT